MPTIRSTGIRGATEAFARARAEQKPIFLSIGYSTCHWCHVMEHESFESPAIAEALNRDFVSIKVDREERPDVDRVYMSFVQATTGSGGWPMSVFLTPTLQPFYGGTYFPPTSRWGRPGFADLLAELARVWRDERAKVDRAATELLDRLKSVTGTDGQSRADRVVADHRSARRRRRAVPDGLRPAARRLRRRARSFRARPSCCSCCASTRAARPAGSAPRRRC